MHVAISYNIYLLCAIVQDQTCIMQQLPYVHYEYYMHDGVVYDHHFYQRTLRVLVATGNEIIPTASTMYIEIEAWQAFGSYDLTSVSAHSISVWWVVI